MADIIGEFLERKALDKLASTFTETESVIQLLLNQRQIFGSIQTKLSKSSRSSLAENYLYIRMISQKSLLKFYESSRYQNSVFVDH